MAKRKKLKVEDATEEAAESKPLMTFPEACIAVTTVALLCGIGMILWQWQRVFGG